MSGSKWRCKYYTITFGKNNFPFDRIGVLLSKRIGNAVERNKIKRKIKEIFRCNKISNPPFLDILIRPQEKYSFGNREDLEQNYLSWISKVKKS